MKRPRPMSLLCLVSLLAAIATLAAPAPVAGRVAGVRESVPDSAAIARAARRAQARFERIRIAALPIVETAGARECEAVIGRLCYWRDDDAKPPTPRERPPVTEARRQLVATLDSLAALSPRDRWIAGQRVRYRIDGGDTTGAVRVATRDCAIDGWWCAALAGYALHIAGDARAAATAYDAALAAMAPEQRCEWDTPAVALPPVDRQRLLALPCGERSGAVARIWWLATPLFTRPANDLRTEYHARQTAAALAAEARHLYDLRWGWDSHELLLRYGSPAWWTRERHRGAAGMTAPSLVGHEASPGFAFLPSSRITFDARAVARADDWDLLQDRPVTRYAPAYARSWSSADAQVARFVRGDSLLVVVAYSARGDTLLRAPAAQLVVSPGPARASAFSSMVASPSGVLEASIPLAQLGQPGLVSVELVDHATRAVARHRSGITALAATGLQMSDLLLHTATDGPAHGARLEEVAAQALTGAAVRSARIGVYWETYGLAPGGEMLDVAMNVEPLNISWARRAAARIGLAARATPLEIRWRETPGGPRGAATRSVAIDLGALAPGDYRLVLTVRRDDGTRASSERVVTIAR